MKRYNNLIKSIIVLLVTLSSTNLWAQQEAQYTHYMYNLMSVNPAYAGTTGAPNVSLLSRQQWMGFDGPQTNLVSAHAPINTGQMGLGFSVISDQEGPINDLYIDLNYAHRINLTQDLTLSLGLKLTALSASASFAEFGNLTTDLAFQDGSAMDFNAGIGAFLYSSNYYVGFSIPRLNEAERVDANLDFGAIQRHYFATAGYVYQLNSDIKLKPSAFYKYAATAPLSLDIALETMLLDTYTIGVNYRVQDAVAALASVRLMEKLTVSYSYGFPISETSETSGGIHEIYLSYDFSKILKKGLESPRFF